MLLLKKRGLPNGMSTRHNLSRLEKVRAIAYWLAINQPTDISTRRFNLFSNESFKSATANWSIAPSNTYEPSFAYCSTSKGEIWYSSRFEVFGGDSTVSNSMQTSLPHAFCLLVWVVQSATASWSIAICICAVHHRPRSGVLSFGWRDLTLTQEPVMALFEWRVSVLVLIWLVFSTPTKG